MSNPNLSNYMVAITNAAAACEKAAAVGAKIDESYAREMQAIADALKARFEALLLLRKAASGAPQWLKDQMEASRRLPPPTAEKVAAQFRAVEDASQTNYDRYRHSSKNP